MKVLFVCTANLCRSPMAAEYLRHRLVHAGLGHVLVDSAGLPGIEGSPPLPESIAVLREHGLDLARHRSRRVRPSDVRSADLIVVMGAEHRERLVHAFPEAAPKVVLLRSFEGGGGERRRSAPDLDDPAGLDEQAVRDSFACIRACIDGLVLHLRHPA